MNTEIELKDIGIKWFHPPDFLVNRPKGSGDYSFMQWLTPIAIRINGVYRVEPPGGCIVFRPADPQWFGGDHFSPFGNNWFHFHGEAVDGILNACAIPLYTVFTLKDNRFVEPLLTRLQHEGMSRRHLWREMTAASLWRFFIEVSRASRKDSIRMNAARAAGKREKFESLRDTLKERCRHPWSVGEMADAVHLSTSRFTRLYKEFFGINPVADLLDMRIGLAEYYLGMTDMPVGKIAYLCGFSDVHYFSRQFKRKTGETPAAFRLLTILPSENLSVSPPDIPL